MSSPLDDARVCVCAGHEWVSERENEVNRIWAVSSQRWRNRTNVCVCVRMFVSQTVGNGPKITIFNSASGHEVVFYFFWHNKHRTWDKFLSQFFIFIHPSSDSLPLHCRGIYVMRVCVCTVHTWRDVGLSVQSFIEFRIEMMRNDYLLSGSWFDIGHKCTMYIRLLTHVRANQRCTSK